MSKRAASSALGTDENKEAQDHGNDSESTPKKKKRSVNVAVEEGKALLKEMGFDDSETPGRRRTRAAAKGIVYTPPPPPPSKREKRTSGGVTSSGRRGRPSKKDQKLDDSDTVQDHEKMDLSEESKVEEKEEAVADKKKLDSKDSKSEKVATVKNSGPKVAASKEVTPVGTEAQSPRKEEAKSDKTSKVPVSDASPGKTSKLAVSETKSDKIPIKVAVADTKSDKAAKNLVSEAKSDTPPSKVSVSDVKLDHKEKSVEKQKTDVKDAKTATDVQKSVPTTDAKKLESQPLKSTSVSSPSKVESLPPKHSEVKSIAPAIPPKPTPSSPAPALPPKPVAPITTEASPTKVPADSLKSTIGIASNSPSKSNGATTTSINTGTTLFTPKSSAVTGTTSPHKPNSVVCPEQPKGSVVSPDSPSIATKASPMKASCPPQTLKTSLPVSAGLSQNSKDDLTSSSAKISSSAPEGHTNNSQISAPMSVE